MTENTSTLEPSNQATLEQSAPTLKPKVKRFVFIYLASLVLIVVFSIGATEARGMWLEHKYKVALEKEQAELEEKVGKEKAARIIEQQQRQAARQQQQQQQREAWQQQQRQQQRRAQDQLRQLLGQ